MEIGPRDAAGGKVTYIRRDKLRDGEKVRSSVLTREGFHGRCWRHCWPKSRPASIAEAKARLDGNIRSDLLSFEAIAAFFGKAADDDEKGGAFKGWVRAPWARPTGAELEQVETRLKALKLTLRNVPAGQAASPGAPTGVCVFTGRPAVEDIIIARAY